MNTYYIDQFDAAPTGLYGLFHAVSCDWLRRRKEFVKNVKCRLNLFTTAFQRWKIALVVYNGVMKSSLVTNIALGAVLGILTLFMGLQYHWLRQAGDVERERLQKRVEADTNNFAGDFNRELQAAFFSFQMDPASWEKGNWEEFAQRYELWRSKTAYPELIREFYYFRKGGVEPLRYDKELQSFIVAPLTSELEALRSKAEAERPVRSFLEDKNVFVMPVFKDEPRVDRVVFRRTMENGVPRVAMPERIGHLAIFLDRSVISDQILPALAAKHFPEGNFRISVTDQDGAAVYQPFGEPVNPDAKAGLMNLTPDNLLILADRGVWSQQLPEKPRGVVVSERIESKTFTHSETTPDGTKTGTFTVEVRPAGPESGNVSTRTSVISTGKEGGDVWTLGVVHNAGSIDSFIRADLTKKFLIGLAIYLLLVGSIVSIVLSSLRARRFAQRQIDFVSSVSHEFRTPLAVIYSASENLADGIAKDQRQVSQYGELIKGEGRKISAMVEQILQFAGARSGKRKYNFTDADVSNIVNTAIEECRPLLEESGVELETSVEANLPTIKADAAALSSALQNLINNSVKYSNGTKWIKVSAENGGGGLRLSVEDRGIGIGGDDLRHIFEPFYRARNVVDAQIHGNGLGLALVKEIAEAHGGKVVAESELGRGSKFTIEIGQSSL
ncbi:MAG TPA: HAMP domain-containing sensor histidine kinase [Pyrinomonadaceae bacterium]|nr:HAMP domain-containing sensor histidine kinase [Pyrinomonadaceae bacterium]